MTIVFIEPIQEKIKIALQAGKLLGVDDIGLVLTAAEGWAMSYALREHSKEEYVSNGAIRKTRYITVPDEIPHKP